MTPQLDIAAARHPLHGTTLTRRRVRWPFVLTTPLRLDAAPADMLTIMLQSSSGAITAGDRLGWRVVAGPSAALHLTTQGATAVHAMPNGTCAEDTLHLHADAGSFVEILPEPLILFPAARLHRRSTLVVDTDAVVLLSDSFLAHDPAGAGRSFGHLAWETEVRRPCGALLLRDRAEIDGGALAGAHASLLLFTPPDRLPASLAADLDAALAPIDGLYAGASALPSGAGLGVRLAAATGGRPLRAGLLAAWTVIRIALTGMAPGRRRGKHAA